MDQIASFNSTEKNPNIEQNFAAYRAKIQN